MFELSSVMDIIKNYLVIYIIEHNIKSIGEMSPNIQDLYFFLKANRSDKLLHIDVVDELMKRK